MQTFKVVLEYVMLVIFILMIGKYVTLFFVVVKSIFIKIVAFTAKEH